MRRHVWVLAFLACLASVASGQEVTLTLDASGLSVKPPGEKAKAGGKLVVTCSGFDCTKLTLKLEELEIAAEANPTATKATFSIPKDAASDQMLKFEAPGGKTLELEVAGAAVEPPAPRSLADLLRRTCGAPTATAWYDAKANIAQIVVSPLGNMLDRPRESIDEDDQVRVMVWGDPDLLPQLRVTRSSPFRDPGGIRIVGSTVDAADIRRLSSKARPPCIAQPTKLGDFEPGKGVIDITVVGAEEEQKIGTVEIGIAPLYTGAFTFGAVWTKLADPTFGLVHNGTDSVITESDDAGDYRVKFALLYTPFLMGRRDLSKPGVNINPTIGLMLKDVSNNVLVGASIDVLGMAYVTAGVHAGKVHRINEKSGLKPGSVFDGTTAELPVQKRWRTDFFISTSIDLRAAVQLLKVVLGAPAG